LIPSRQKKNKKNKKKSKTTLVSPQKVIKKAHEKDIREI